MTKDLKFRLKFLFQQIDLSSGEFLIGRSPSCNLTLEDPLVSRHHASITVSGGHAIICDLNSRNGTELNSGRLKEKTALTDNDRIRIGAHEMIFIVEKDGAGRNAKTTGALITCPSCKVTMSSLNETCPHCSAIIAPKTICPNCECTTYSQNNFCSHCGAPLGDHVSHAEINNEQSEVPFELVICMLEKSLQTDNPSLTKKYATTAIHAIEERPPELRNLIQITELVTRAAQQTKTAAFIKRVLSIWEAHDLVLPEKQLNEMATVCASDNCFVKLRPMLAEHIDTMAVEIQDETTTQIDTE